MNNFNEKLLNSMMPKVSYNVIDNDNGELKSIDFYVTQGNQHFFIEFQNMNTTKNEQEPIAIIPKYIVDNNASMINTVCLDMIEKSQKFTLHANNYFRGVIKK